MFWCETLLGGAQEPALQALPLQAPGLQEQTLHCFLSGCRCLTEGRHKVDTPPPPFASLGSRSVEAQEDEGNLEELEVFLKRVAEFVWKCLREARTERESWWTPERRTLLTTSEQDRTRRRVWAKSVAGKIIHTQGVYSGRS